MDLSPCVLPTSTLREKPVEYRIKEQCTERRERLEQCVALALARTLGPKTSSYLFLHSIKGDTAEFQAVILKDMLHIKLFENREEKKKKERKRGRREMANV